MAALLPAQSKLKALHRFVAEANARALTAPAAVQPLWQKPTRELLHGTSRVVRWPPWQAVAEPWTPCSPPSCPPPPLAPRMTQGRGLFVGSRDFMGRRS